MESLLSLLTGRIAVASEIIFPALVFFLILCMNSDVENKIDHIEGLHFHEVFQSMHFKDFFFLMVFLQYFSIRKKGYVKIGRY